MKGLATMRGIQIRLATVDDAQGVANVHVRSWQHAYQGQIPAEHLRSLSIATRAQRWREILRNPAPHSQLLVAVEREGEDSIIGFCGVGPCRDDDAAPSTGEIYAVYVAPDQTGRGVGSALLRAGVAALAQQGSMRMTLWVLATNSAAQQFYRRHGFMPDGTRKTESIGGADVVEVRYVYDDADTDIGESNS